EKPKPAAPATPAQSGRAGANGAGNRPSIRQAQQQQAQGGGFQRLDVNQSGDLAAAGQEGAISNEVASELSGSASSSLVVSGSVSTGLGMPEMGDWGGPGAMQAMMMGGG